MIFKYGVIAVFTCLLLLSGCSTTPKRDGAGQFHSSVNKQLPNQKLPNQKRVKQALYSQHKKWKATPYKLGGNTRKGIDCSGFVKVTFLSRFGMKLPRTTKFQAKIGKRISQKKLKAGDLVFFKTSLSVRHVGMYLEGRRFLHASSSKGVMISSLDNKYWAKKYWKAVRP